MYEILRRYDFGWSSGEAYKECGTPDVQPFRGGRTDVLPCKGIPTQTYLPEQRVTTDNMNS